MIYVLTGFKNKADKRALSIQEFKDRYYVAGYLSSLFGWDKAANTDFPIPVTKGNVLRDPIDSDNPHPCTVYMDKEGLWNFCICFGTKKEAERTLIMLSSLEDDKSYSEFLNSMLKFEGLDNSESLKDKDYTVFYRKMNDDVWNEENMLTQEEATQMAWDCYLKCQYDSSSIKIARTIPAFISIGNEDGEVENVRI